MATRYHSAEALSCLNRTKAIESWQRARAGEPLERVLTAFDMFVLRDGHGDFVDVGASTTREMIDDSLSPGV